MNPMHPVTGVIDRVAHVIAQVPSITPDPQGFPGGEALASLAGGLMWVALIAITAGFFIGAIIWALSSHSSPYGVIAGKRTMLVSTAAALLVGSANAIVRWAFSVGQGVR